jgi:ABC-type Fe3+ transport system permease subunit
VAQRTFSIIANTLLLFVVFGPLVVLLFNADQNLTFTKADWAALKFTLKQAALSSLLSAINGMAVGLSAISKTLYWQAAFNNYFKRALHTSRDSCCVRVIINFW